ncbi:MAG: histidine--tRNA ligase [Herpetosiphonaceae bacterium]|nr:MAG: histidine--tRNA ligase [Herpetosiphonaceae bacterium]
MPVKPQTYRGMRDHLPRAMILRQFIIDTLTRVFELHGFEPLSTPIIEYAETLEGKIGDEEKLLFRFQDHGGREVALRYDQTVPLARVVAQYPNEIVLPFKRYAIGPSYRGERPQRGRYREFWQADIDIVGSASPLADAEIIAVISEALTALGFKGFRTLINHRDLLSGLARVAGVDEEQAAGIYRAIDKLDKIGPEGVREELLKYGLAADSVERILEFVQIEGAPDEVLAELAPIFAGDTRAAAALENLRAITSTLEEMGVDPATYVLAPRLARGLSYYTGAVFETVVDEPPMGSLLGGGRYDELIGLFSNRPLPTVGLAFGIERLHDVMEELGMGPGRSTVADAYVTLFSPELIGESLKLAAELRAAGVRTLTALEPGGLGKQFKEADRKGVPFALVLGPDELARGEIQLKNLRTGEQRSLPRSEAIAELAGQQA